MNLVIVVLNCFSQFLGYKITSFMFWKTKLVFEYLDSSFFIGRTFKRHKFAILNKFFHETTQINFVQQK